MILDWELLALYLQVLATGVIGYFAFNIGKKQNEINANSLKLHDFADVFLMPQRVVAKTDSGQEKLIGFNVLIKSVSSYPIYLNAYVLNGTKFDIGSSIIPPSSSDWFAVGVSQDVQDKGFFSLEVYFEDFEGRKYKTEAQGQFYIESQDWSVKSTKRINL